jgi:hypothetical protein
LIAFRVFAAASAIVAVHAITDAFLAPEQGTTWNDHLVPGLATVALIGASVACFAVARAGVRAALALVLGALAIEGAVLALLDARNVGPHGDDWTGFLLAPVGIVLCATGVCVLWRARRGGRYRHLRRAGLALVAVVGAYCLVAPLAMAIAATHRPRQAVSTVHLGRPYEPVTLKTRDGSPRGMSARATARPSSPTRPARGSCRRRESWSATATASCFSTHAATTPATARPTSSAGARQRTSMPPSTGCADDPMSTTDASAASASPSAAK